MEVSISEWGNSLGVRIPKSIALETGLKKGTKVEVKAEDGKVTINRLKPKSKAKTRKKYTIEELMADTTPEDYRNALSPEDWKFWQTDVGREIIED